MVLATAPRPLPLALLAGDDDSRSMYGQSLTLARWAVEEAADGREALAIALHRRPDVIISDTHLPGISGFDLCSILRRDIATRATPIVLVTSDAQARDLERARRAGATSVLVKPCLPDTLIAEALKLVEESRALRHRSVAMPEKIPGRLASADRLLDTSAASRRIMSRTHRREETELPPSAPPPLVCPDCDRPLDYKSSQVGGVSARNSEQWDYFVCGGGCGMFQYRQRTRKLRKV